MTSLDLLAAGQSNTAIAQRLGLSEKTIRNNVSAILAKLQVSDRPSAIVRARNAGLGGVAPGGAGWMAPGTTPDHAVAVPGTVSAGCHAGQVRSGPGQTQLYWVAREA